MRPEQEVVAALATHDEPRPMAPGQEQIAAQERHEEKAEPHLALR